MKDNEKIYCAFCGTKNKKTDKKCSKCDKKLNPRNHLFKDYLKDHIKDDIDGDIQDSILEIIENWIRTHLFGIGFTALIGIVGVSIALNEMNLNNIINSSKSYKSVDKPFTLKVFCEEKPLSDKVRVCDEGYTLEGDTCVVRYSVDAKRNTVCPNNYTLSGSTCISNYTVDKLESFTCDAIPSIMIGADGWRRQTFGTIISDNKCYARLCHENAGVAGPSSINDCASVEYVESSKTSTYYCAKYTDLNGNCHDTTGVSYKYTCSYGELNGTKCNVTETKEYNEVCPEGTTFDVECQKCIKGGE